MNGGGGFSGGIDDLRFWNRARTAQEIRDSFTSHIELAHLWRDP